MIILLLLLNELYQLTITNLKKTLSDCSNFVIIVIFIGANQCAQAYILTFFWPPYTIWKKLNQ
ncbi:MAG: hypothetical protein CMF39_03985 [Legionellaceae bacterium]|nr:hypothetical protein [Legionellaceae bacterium]